MVGFVMMFVFGMVFIYLFWVIVILGAFWFVCMGEVHELFDGVYWVGLYFVIIYLCWLCWSFMFVVLVGVVIIVLV